MANKKGTMKAVFTLKSGKSIVISMSAKECLDAYGMWIRYIQRDIPVDKLGNLSDIPIVPLLTFQKYDYNGNTTELSSIEITEISAIQILQNKEDYSD